MLSRDLARHGPATESDLHSDVPGVADVVREIAKDFWETVTTEPNPNVLISKIEDRRGKDHDSRPLHSPFAKGGCPLAS